MWEGLVSFLTANKEALAALADIAAIIGVPAGFVLFLLAKRKERQIKEYETFSALDDRYIEFQRLCIEHPHLDLHELSDGGERVPTETEKLQQQAAYAILFSIFERAFIMFKDQSTPMQEKQGKGWKDYMNYYFKRPHVRAAWSALNQSGQYDADFTAYVQREFLS